MENQTNTSSTGVQWAELKFPPLNLHNIYPTPAMVAIHAKHVYETMGDLWDEDLNKE